MFILNNHQERAYVIKYFFPYNLYFISPRNMNDEPHKTFLKRFQTDLDSNQALVNEAIKKRHKITEY